MEIDYGRKPFDFAQGKHLFAPTILFIFVLLFCAPVHADAQAIDISNRAYFSAVSTAIDNAKHSIKAAMYCLYVHAGEEDNPAYKLLTRLIAAQKRGVEVTVYLDHTPANAKANQTAADILKQNGVAVYFVDHTKKLHAKVIVIDDETVIEGSTNWTGKALNENFESDILLRDKDLAAAKAKFFDALTFEQVQNEPMVLVPVYFLESAKAGKMVANRDRDPFDLYMLLLRLGRPDWTGGHGGQAWIAIDYDTTAFELGAKVTAKGGHRRAIRKAAKKLKDRYSLIDYALDDDFNLKVKLVPIEGERFGLPLRYWQSGAVRELSIGEKLFCLIGYYHQEMARPSYYWRRPMEWMGEHYGVGRGALSRAMMALRRKDIVEVQFARAPDKDYKNKDASQYHMNGFVSATERAQAWAELAQELGGDKVTQARGLNKMIDRDESIETAREFVALIDDYGYTAVLAATRKVAAFKHQNPLRNVRYIGGVVKNEH